MTPFIVAVLTPKIDTEKIVFVELPPCHLGLATTHVDSAVVVKLADNAVILGRDTTVNDRKLAIVKLQIAGRSTMFAGGQGKFYATGIDTTKYAALDPIDRLHCTISSDSEPGFFK